MQRTRQIAAFIKTPGEIQEGPKKIEKYKCGPAFCKEDPAARIEMRLSPQPLLPPDQCRLCEELRRRHRGHTTWNAA
jgi:hypothetical protein